MNFLLLSSYRVNNGIGKLALAIPDDYFSGFRHLLSPSEEYFFSYYAGPVARRGSKAASPKVDKMLTTLLVRNSPIKHF